MGVGLGNILFVTMVVASTARGAASGRQPGVVFFLKAKPSVPERLRLLTRGAGDQPVEMHVPAGSDAQHVRAARQAAMGNSQQHFLAPCFELERNVAGVVPGE